ncbi:TPA: YebG family protein [Pseudomonas putida]|nr:YebG family protein [Pseudomonas putida]
MAVETFYRSTHDKENKMFANRKEAQEYDQMLEIGLSIAETLERSFPDMDERRCEDLGIFIAKNRGAFTSAFKGKVDELTEINAAAPAD